MKHAYATYKQTLGWNNGRIGYFNITDEQILKADPKANNINKEISSIRDGDRPVVSIIKEEDDTVSIYDESLLRAYQYLKFNNIPFMWVGNLVSRFNQYLGLKYSIEPSEEDYESTLIMVVRSKENNLRYACKCSDQISLLNEYRVGLELNKFDLNFLVKTYDYYSDVGFECLITEFLTDDDNPLPTLTWYMNNSKVSLEDKVSVLKTLSYMCVTFSNLRFTHWDLYGRNILIDRNSSQVYNFGEIKVKCPVKIFIIDFEFGYIKSSLEEEERFNPIQDICSIIYIFHNQYKVKLPKSYELLSMEEFDPENRINYENKNNIGRFIETLEMDTKW